jgi:hypothetical protein
MFRKFLAGPLFQSEIALMIKGGWCHLHYAVVIKRPNLNTTTTTIGHPPL